MASSATRKEQFQQWVRHHAGILHRTANGFAEGEDRNDLMQELLLAVWRSIPAFRGESRVSTFLYQVAHNAALTWRRGQRTRERRMEAYRRETLPADSAEDAGHRDPALLERLYQEIRRLPPLDRSLLLLSLDGMSYAEMAAIHGLSEGNVGARLTRARQKLTTRMKEQTYE